MSELLIPALDPAGSAVPRSTGAIINNMKMKVLHPETRKPLSFNEPGEIMIKSPSVSCYTEITLFSLNYNQPN